MRPGRTKKTTDRLVGKTRGGRYVPNDGAPAAIMPVDSEVKDCGAYAVAMAAGLWAYELLLAVFDARLRDGGDLGAQGLRPGLPHLGRLPRQRALRRLARARDGEDARYELLQQLGRHQVTCVRFEQALMDQGSGTYAIVRHLEIASNERISFFRVRTCLSIRSCLYSEAGLKRAGQLTVGIRR